MIPYLLLVFLSAAFSLIAIRRHERSGGYSVLIGRSTYIRETSLALPVFFFLLFLLLAVRDETIGRDLPGYHYYFLTYSEQSLKELCSSWSEVLFRWLTWLIGQVTSSFQLYLAIVAAITIIPIAKVYAEDRRHSYLKIILFVNMSTFVLPFSGIRQSIALAVGMVAYSFVRDRKIVPFIIAVLVAIMIHHSGFVILFMYPLYHMRCKRRHLLFIVPLIATVFVFNEQIFGFLSAVLSQYSDKYNVSIAPTGAYGSLLLFIAFAVISYVIGDERLMDEETIGLRSFLLLAIAIQCFAPLHHLAMRLNYYYILFIPVLIPKALDAIRGNRKLIRLAAEYGMCLFFTVYFVVRTYAAYRTGGGSLDIVPYLPFWAR